MHPMRPSGNPSLPTLCRLVTCPAALYKTCCSPVYQLISLQRADNCRMQGQQEKSKRLHRGLPGSKTCNHYNCKRHHSTLLEASTVLVGDPHTWLCWLSLRPIAFETPLTLAKGKLALSSCHPTLTSPMFQPSPASLVPLLALCCHGECISFLNIKASSGDLVGSLRLAGRLLSAPLGGSEATVTPAMARGQAP